MPPLRRWQQRRPMHGDRLQPSAVASAQHTAPSVREATATVKPDHEALVRAFRLRAARRQGTTPRRRRQSFRHACTHVTSCLVRPDAKAGRFTAAAEQAHCSHGQHALAGTGGGHRLASWNERHQEPHGAPPEPAARPFPTLDPSPQGNTSHTDLQACAGLCTRACRMTMVLPPVVTLRHAPSLRPDGSVTNEATQGHITRPTRPAQWPIHPHPRHRPPALPTSLVPRSPCPIPPSLHRPHAEPPCPLVSPQSSTPCKAWAKLSSSSPKTITNS